MNIENRCEVINRAIRLRNQYYCKYYTLPNEIILGQTEIKQLMLFCKVVEVENMKNLHIIGMYIKISPEINHMSVRRIK